MHVVLAYKPILVDVVFEHVKINSMKKKTENKSAAA